MPASSSDSELAALQRRIVELEFLTYHCAHDLQGPLATIAGFLKGLSASAKAGDWDIFDADIDRITRLVDQQRQTLDGLLQLVRVDRHAELLQPLAMRPLIERVVAELNELCRPDRLMVTVPDEWPVVHGTEALLEAVWSNLLVNAIHYASHQGTTEVQIDCEASGQELIISVRDHGPGIAESDRQRAFDPFVRFHESIPGTGLGLCIVQRALRRLGGRVWIDSPAEGPGTVICFTLPMADQSPA